MRVIPHRKKSFFLLVGGGIAALLILVCLLLAGDGDGSRQDGMKVFSVDAQPVSMEEFQAKMKEKKPEIYVYFNDKYGANLNQGFWTTPLGGEVPLDKLKEQALHDLVRIKMEQIVGKEEGVIQDISYAAFLHNLAKENTSRQDAIKTNKVMYGTTSVTALNYFRTLHDAMVTEVKDKLGKNEFHINQEQIKQSYEEEKEKLYKVQDTIKVKEFTVSPVNGNNDAKTVAEQIKSLLDKGLTINDIVKDFSGNASVKINLQDQVFNKENSENGDDIYVLLSPEASKLQAGQAGNVIEGDESYYVLYCIERAGNGYLPLEEVEGLIVARYVNQKYNAMIDQRVQRAKVEINRGIYDRITGE